MEEKYKKYEIHHSYERTAKVYCNEYGKAIITEIRDLDGNLHAEDGTWTVSTPDYFEYHRHGKLHREDGPAIEYKKDSLNNKYFLDGVEYSKNDFRHEIDRRMSLRHAFKIISEYENLEVDGKKYKLIIEEEK